MGDQENNTSNLPTWQEFQQGIIMKTLKDDNFRKELLADPKAVLEQEMAKIKPGAKLPKNFAVQVLEQPANTLYLVLPAPNASELSDEELDTVAGGVVWGEPVFKFNLGVWNPLRGNYE